MTQQQIYDLVIRMGIKADLRGESRVKKLLVRTKEKYERLNKEQKEEFDQEKLTNPYSDTRILVDTNKPIKKILVGIDIAGAELYLADKLKVDLIISHHPLGKAFAASHEAMHLQAEVLEKYGVPINIAESLLKVRISEVSRGVHPINHNRIVDAAKILGIGLMCVHTPADNLVAEFLESKIKKAKPEYVGDLMKLINDIPEYKEATKISAGPKIFTGNEDNRCGKIAMTDITGGTFGSSKIYVKMSQAGIGTVVGMHMNEESKKKAETAHINVVIAGHMSSDSLGINLFLDEIEKKGIEIISCSGLTRIKRYKK